MKTFAFISLGVVIACVLGAITGLMRRPSTRVDLTPTTVMVSRADLAEGAEVSADVAGEAPLPAAYVTESMIRPADWPRLRGRKVTFAVQAGDVLTWQQFARVDRQLATQKCILSLNAGMEAAAEAAAQKELDALQLAELTPSAPPAAPPGDNVRVVGLAKDLHEGAELTAASLRIIEVPRAFFTESLILESEQTSIIGAKVVSEVLEGDVLNWPLLLRDSVNGPNTCVARLTAAAHRAREDFAKKGAAAFEGGAP